MYELRDLFGKTSLSSEDEIRLASIRSSSTLAEIKRAEGYTPENFLREAEGQLVLSFAKEPPDSRALELINKTNQFNLNGKRHTDASWKQYLSDPKVFLMVAAYEDRFGPLGKIAVVTGRVEDDRITVDHWVMSCRAFSRRIEHSCFLRLFHKFDVQEAMVDFSCTSRNKPVQEFFAELLGVTPVAPFSISRQQLIDNSPPVYLGIQERCCA